MRIRVSKDDDDDDDRIYRHSPTLQCAVVEKRRNQNQLGKYGSAEKMWRGRKSLSVGIKGMEVERVGNSRKWKLYSDVRENKIEFPRKAYTVYFGASFFTAVAFSSSFPSQETSLKVLPDGLNWIIRPSFMATRFATEIHDMNQDPKLCNFATRWSIDGFSVVWAEASLLLSTNFFCYFSQKALLFCRMKKLSPAKKIVLAREMLFWKKINFSSNSPFRERMKMRHFFLSELIQI